MSVDATPPFNSINRQRFVTSGTFPTTPYYSISAGNMEQAASKDNMAMGVFSLNVSTTGLNFPVPSYGTPTETGAGATIAVYWDSGTSQILGTQSLPDVAFTYTVGQDANGNQWQDGLGVKFENKLIEQTFTATYDSSDSTATWDWTAGTATITNVSVTVTAGEVDWSSYSGYSATITADQEYASFLMWDGEFNYEYKVGWFNPPDLYWYGTDATVVVKRLIGVNGTDPGYTTPDQWQGVVNVAFTATEITPPAKAYV